MEFKHKFLIILSRVLLIFSCFTKITFYITLQRRFFVFVTTKPINIFKSIKVLTMKKLGLQEFQSYVTLVGLPYNWSNNPGSGLSKPSHVNSARTIKHTDFP